MLKASIVSMKEAIAYIDPIEFAIINPDVDRTQKLPPQAKWLEKPRIPDRLLATRQSLIG